jgi:hypothetical protein
MGEPVLDTIGEKGDRRPVLHTMALGEDLLVTVRFELLGDDVDEVKPGLESSTLRYKSARKVGPGEFEIRLHPGQAGKATGILRIAPLETSSKEVPPIKLEVNVEELRDQDDAGSRPRDVGDVGRFLGAAIVEIFKRRSHGVENVYKQAQEKDRPPATPLWQTLLKHAVTIAINAVSAGLGAKLAGAHVADSDNKPFATELMKVLFEQTMSTAATTAVDKIIESGDGSPSAGKSRSGPRRAMGVMFNDAQQKALSAEEREAKQRHLSTVENMVKRKEAERPGSGFRAALRLEAELGKAVEIAETMQYLQTFQRWCSVLAANALNTEVDDGLTTNLGGSVDVDKVAQMPEEKGPPDQVRPGLSRTPGVLNLVLTKKDLEADKGSHPLKVTSASISGLASQDFRSTIKEIPIKELQIPIVASYSKYAGSAMTLKGAQLSPEKLAFVIGRNEGNRYWASEVGESLSILLAGRMGQAGKIDPREAARHIIMNEIGDETVEPQGA